MGERVLFQGNYYQILGFNQTGDRVLLGDLRDLRNQFAVDVYAVAKTRGCVNSRNGDICVDDLTMGSNNYYYRVIGIQYDGLLVVGTTNENPVYYPNIDPLSLVVVQ
jgi:hypothetical protein